MNASTDVFVTLPAELLSKLREQSRQQGIPFLWLVAGLACDTMESAAGSVKSSLKCLAAE